MMDKIKCPACGSVYTRYSTKYTRYDCEDCGHEFTMVRSASPLRLFLSYGHDSNEDLVRRIKADLEKRGHNVWFDKSEIKAGDDWRRAITDGIVGSHRVLSFLSKYSTRDPGVCLDEIAIAIGVKGGNIQTILVESETEVRPPASISHVQWLDMHDWKKRRADGEAAWEEWYESKLAEIVRVVESDESRRFAGEIETLNHYLKPISSDSRIGALLKKGFIGRRWLTEAVDVWRNTTDRTSRLYWITGEPGVGKSAFSAHLTHFGRDTIIAAQFIEWDKPDHRNAARVIRSLAFQIATRLPDYRKLLLTLAEIAELDRKDPFELFDYLLANPLRSVIHGGRERYLIVIDALDEANEFGHNPLVEMLARDVQRLPDWIGLVVTSRPESAVTTPLQGLKPHIMNTSTEANRADIREYLRHELGSQLENHPDKERLIEHVLEKSEGIFLYVERVCHDLRQGTLSLDQLDDFPQGLGGVFSQFFQRQFSDLEQYRQQVRPALRAILAAREPLPVDILKELFNWQDEELHDFLRTLGSLFPITGESGFEVVKPYHKSLADWLMDEAKAGAYFVSEMEGHRILACRGLSEVNRDLCAAHPYIIANLPWHLVETYDFTGLVATVSLPEYTAEMRRLGRMGKLMYLCSDLIANDCRLPGSQRNALELWIKESPEEVISRHGHELFLLERFRATPKWSTITPDDQAVYCETASDLLRILLAHGFIVHRAVGTGPLSLMEFEEEEVQQLARQEHERWCRLRQACGWVYGPRRDATNRVSPYLVHWSVLPDNMLDWDFCEVRRWPEMLALLHCEIKRIAELEKPLDASQYINLTNGTLAEQRDIIESVAEKYWSEDWKRQNESPTERPWADLQLELKLVRWEEVMATINNLNCVGLDVRPVRHNDTRSEQAAADDMFNEFKERLAELEHDRWRKERNAWGWTYGPMYDLELKQSPALVPWPDLSEELRDYDRKAIHYLPEIFAKAGYEICTIDAAH